ncbi:MAG: XRE family transcriptional regulator [Syntrophobacter sp.]
MATEPQLRIGQRIRQFRKRLGINQAELAERLGVNSAETISQIERGGRDLKAWELSKLARILLVEMPDLLEPETDPISPVLWRAEHGMGYKKLEAAFLKRCHQYAFLESVTGKESHDSFPQKAVDPENLTFNQVERLAEEVARQFGLGTKPAAVLEGILEDTYGVKIWYAPMEEGSAASVLGPFGPAILMNSNEAPWRRNYNFAHEVFHLITWKSIPPDRLSGKPQLRDKIERFANSFASHLLLPAESLLGELRTYITDNQLSYGDLIDLARSFHVSTEALAYRLLTLKQLKRQTVDKLLADPAFRGLDKCSMAACWRPVPPLIPERFVRLGFLAYTRGKISKAKFASLLDASIADLNHLLREYGLGDDKAKIETQVRVA